jgi:xanthine dehydrogenase YagR molybdenum-binding subunit
VVQIHSPRPFLRLASNENPTRCPPDRADCVVAVNADVPPIDVHFLDYPDKEINELGAREIGLTGIAAAITAAVHHATGVRVRELPVRTENLSA